MRTLTLLVFGFVAASAVGQTDHDNLDAGRPLSFEDAEPIARFGFAIELGIIADLRARRDPLAVPLAAVWGIAPNTQLEVGMALSRNSSFEAGVLYSFNRELPDLPALAGKVEVGLDERGETRWHAKGIATRTVNQYDRLHLNVGVEVGRRARFDAVLGYTKPLGYPRHFDTTGLAEVSVRDSETGWIPGVGLGIRRQMTPTSVLDLGIQAELAGTGTRPFRVIVGYSTNF